MKVQAVPHTPKRAAHQRKLACSPNQQAYIGGKVADKKIREAPSKCKMNADLRRAAQRLQASSERMAKIIQKAGEHNETTNGFRPSVDRA